MYEEDLTKYSFKKLEDKSGTLNLKLDSEEASSCSVDYEFGDENEGGYSYVLVGFRGARYAGDGKHTIGVSTCGIVLCQEGSVEDLSKCGKILKDKG